MERQSTNNDLCLEYTIDRDRSRLLSDNRRSRECFCLQPRLHGVDYAAVHDYSFAQDDANADVDQSEQDSSRQSRFYADAERDEFRPRGGRILWSGRVGNHGGE